MIPSVARRNMIQGDFSGKVQKYVIKRWTIVGESFPPSCQTPDEIRFTLSVLHLLLCSFSLHLLSEH